MTKKALIILADGSEEMEAVIIIDILRRGGVEVTVAGLNGSDPIKCSRDVMILPDNSLTDAISQSPYDAIILPGGLKGAESLSKSELVGEVLRNQEKEGRIVAAICAAPTALQAHSIGKGKTITSYPAMKKYFTEDYHYVEDLVVVDGNLTTSRGPGTAVEFSLSLVEQLAGKEVSETLVKHMLLKL